jgi:hypothetical protein
MAVWMWKEKQKEGILINMKNQNRTWKDTIVERVKGGSFWIKFAVNFREKSNFNMRSFHFLI